MGHTVKKVVSFLLIICFITADLSRALADDTNNANTRHSNVALDPGIFSTMDPDKYTVKPEDLSPEDQAEMHRVLAKPTQNVQEIMFLLKNLYYKVRLAEEAKGESGVKNTLLQRKDSESISYELEHVGKAEPLVLISHDGPKYFTKVRHNGLKMSVLFIDITQINLPFLEESERLVKLGLEGWDKSLENLSPEQIKEQLKYRQFILNHMRTLYAKMLMNEWSPSLEYKPLSEITEDEKTAEPKEKPPEEIQKQVDAVLKKPLASLKNESWFKKVSTQAYSVWVDLPERAKDKWVDLATQEKNKTQAVAGNDSLMIVMYDGKTGIIEETQTINKPAKTSLQFWKMYWKAMFEKPAYREDLWKDSKTKLGKMRVLVTGDYALGWIFGVGLAGLAGVASWMMNGSLPEGLTALYVASVSLRWSLFFGIFSKTWQNYVYRGNEFTRFVKNWSTGIGQSYHLNLASSESLSLIDNAGKFDPNAARTHADVLINQSIKSTGKTSIQELYRHRAKTNEASGTILFPYFKFKVPFKDGLKLFELEATQTEIEPMKIYKWVRNQFTVKPYIERSWEEHLIFRFNKDFRIKLPWVETAYFNTAIPRKNFEGQLPQVATTPIGILSRFGLMVGYLPLGHILYALLAPIGEARQINYKIQYVKKMTHQNGFRDAQTNREREALKVELRKWYSLKLFRIHQTPLETAFNFSRDRFFELASFLESKNLNVAAEYAERTGYTLDYMKRFKGVPGTQIPGYFVNFMFIVIPKNIWEATKSLSKWALRKAAYYSYEAFTGVQEMNNVANAERKASEEQSERFRELMTVQSDGGKPHPEQIQNGISKYGRCSGFFK